jgi:hypothetical protein
MPCPLTSDFDYPDYIKNILKEIDNGDNKELKSCACQMVTPVSEDGCILTDEDNKVGLFPFCCTLVTDGVGDDTEYPLKLTLKQAMDLYWQTTSWKFSANANSSSSCSTGGGNSWSINYTQNKRTASSTIGEIPPSKNLVCPSIFYYSTNYNGSSCFSDGCHPFSAENYIVASIFESLNGQMKYKKEGSTYYFYPYFHLGALGTYGTCAGTTTTIASQCDGSDWGSPTNYNVSVKIFGKTVSAPLKIYQKLFTAGNCSYSGSSSISTLEFI